MKQRLTVIARDVDLFCAKLNDGLAAVAILLGFFVVTMGVIRAQEIVTDVATSTPAFYQIAMEE